MHIYVTITIATIIATTIAITIATLICIAIIKYQIVCNNTEKDFIANIGLVIVVAIAIAMVIDMFIVIRSLV